jgi:hypothetical protein
MKWFNDAMDYVDTWRPDFHDFRQSFFWDMLVAMTAIVFSVVLAMLTGLDNENGPSLAGLVFLGLGIVIGFLMILRAVLRAKHDADD